MSRDWKPGDVAVTRFGRSVVVSGNHCGHSDSQPHWHHVGGGWDPLDSHPVAPPLVVIDPEDREQVERLTVAHCLAYCSDPAPCRPEEVTAMQAALREFANPTPPKPEEPTGLGAVVEDVNGDRWILVYDEVGDVRQWAQVGRISRIDQWLEWVAIAAVRVLSEGVTR